MTHFAGETNSEDAFTDKLSNIALCSQVTKARAMRAISGTIVSLIHIVMMQAEKLDKYMHIDRSITYVEKSKQHFVFPAN